MFFTYEWANGEGRSRIQFNPEKIEVRMQDQNQIYVKPRTPERTLQFVECLEANGFTYDSRTWRTREDAIESGFPIGVSFDEKTYTSLAGVTNAACACSAGIVAPEGLFYDLCRDHLDSIPDSAAALAQSWKDEPQEGPRAGCPDGLYRIDQAPREQDATQ